MICDRLLNNYDLLSAARATLLLRVLASVVVVELLQILYYSSSISGPINKQREEAVGQSRESRVALQLAL